MTLDPHELGRTRADLAETLRTLRKRAGLSGARLAERVAMSQSKVSKIETGKTTPTLVDVGRILRALEAPESLVTEVLALARIANTEWQDSRALRRKGLARRQVELASLEQASTEFRFFLLSMITGLLSTPEYIRASLAHIPGNHAKTTAKKLERQEILHDADKQFTFILAEQACRWPLVAGPAMAMQLDHLASISRLPSVHLGVVPMRGYMPGCPLNTFTVYDRYMTTVETTTGLLVFRDAQDIESYLEEFSQYAEYALWGDEARSQLQEWSNSYR